MDADTTAQQMTTSDDGPVGDTELEATPTEESQTSAPEAKASQERSFSQAEVEQMMRERLERERRRWKRDQESQEKRPAEAPKAKAKAESAEPAPSVSEPSSREWRAFERSVGALGLNDRQITVLEDMFLSERPDRADIIDFVKDAAAELGWVKSEPQPAQRDATQAKEPPVQPKKQANPAAIDNNVAAAQTGWKQQVSPDALTADQIAQIINEKGLRAGQKFIRNWVERYHRNTRVVPPSDK